MPDTEVKNGDSGAPSESEGKRFSFPSALTVLALVLLFVWLAAFLIPSGTYQLDEAGSPIAGTYEEISSCDGADEGTPCVDKG